MYAAGQAGVEAADGAHNIDTFEFVRAILLEDGRVLHGIFVRTRRPVDISGIGIPGRRRIGMIVGDLTIANDDVM